MTAIYRIHVDPSAPPLRIVSHDMGSFDGSQKAPLSPRAAFRGHVDAPPANARQFYHLAPGVLAVPEDAWHDLDMYYCCSESGELLAIETEFGTFRAVNPLEPIPGSLDGKAPCDLGCVGVPNLFRIEGLDPTDLYCVDGIVVEGDWFRSIYKAKGYTGLTLSLCGQNALKAMPGEDAAQRVGADERFGMRLQRSQLNPVLGGRGAHDNVTNHRDDLRVRHRAGCRHLLYARTFAPRRGGPGRRRRGGMLGPGRDHRRGSARRMAGFPAPGTRPVGALLPRARDLVVADLPHHLAGGSQVWVARVGGVSHRCGSCGPTAGLSVRCDLPGVGVRSRRAWLQSSPMPQRISASWRWGMR